MIDTPEAAYWMGLLAADGWIVTERDRPTGVALALHEKDVELLKQYAAFVGFRAAPRRTRPTAELFQVKITSSLMAADLIGHGITPRKSKTLQLPKLAPELLSPFFRGLFDGDGSVVSRGSTLTAQLTTASEDLADSLAQALNPPTLRPCGRHRDRNTHVLRWYSDNAISLARFMYGESGEARPRLERKAEIFFGFQGSGAGHSWVRY